MKIELPHPYLLRDYRQDVLCVLDARKKQIKRMSQDSGVPLRTVYDIMNRKRPGAPPDKLRDLVRAAAKIPTDAELEKENDAKQK